MKAALLISTLSLALATVPLAAADDLVGASGQCYDADGNGGHDELHVTDAGDVTAPTGGVAAGVAEFAENTAADPAGDPCPGAEGANGETMDYLEVHAAGAQVCYRQQTFFTDGHCPTSPGGPA